jgi:hypothetical protein
MIAHRCITWLHTTADRETAQQLKEQKAKALEAQQALHAAKISMHRAAQTRRHTLTIATN